MARRSAHSICSADSWRAAYTGARPGRYLGMDHTGVTPPVALSAPDLAELVLGAGPFLTVYLATEASIENAAQRSELRWKDLRRDLEGRGADETALTAVDPLVADA